MPRIGIVAVGAAKQAAGHEQHDAQAGPVIAGRRLVGMHVAERALGVVLTLAFVRRVGRDADAQIVPAAGSRLPTSDIASCPSQIWPWKVRLITSCCCSRVSRTKLTA